MKVKCDNCGRRFNKGDTNRYTCPHCNMLTVESYALSRADIMYHSAGSNNYIRKQDTIDYALLQTLFNIINMT